MNAQSRPVALINEPKHRLAAHGAAVHPAAYTNPYRCRQHSTVPRQCPVHGIWWQALQQSQEVITTGRKDEETVTKFFSGS